MNYYHYDVPDDSPLRGITFTTEGEELTALWFDDQKDVKEIEFTCVDNVAASDTKRWLDMYFSGRDPGFTPKLRAVGTEFRKTVWEMLLNIPYGQTMTYGEIAAGISESMSAQAVGGAVGHNPIAIIIPCHRVIGSDGSLTGYAGGLDKKAYLLELEK